MTYYQDLSTCYYFGEGFGGQAELIVAVGWLSAREDYARGSVPAVARDRLASLLCEAWQPVSFLGSHTCQLCGGARSHRNLFLPGQGKVLVAPEGILHYIDNHGYLPPQEFIRAVLSCPPMGSQDYFRALVREGGLRWSEDLGLPESSRVGPADQEPAQRRDEADEARDEQT